MRPGLQRADGSFQPLDFAFPIMHGTFAEDGTIQGLLEMSGVAYAGSVMIVAGLLLTSTTSRPSLRRALHACDPE